MCEHTIANRQRLDWPISALRENEGACRETRVSGNDEMNFSTPRASVESGEIVPEKRFLQGLFNHPRQDAGCGESVPLDVAHSSSTISEDELESQFDTSESATETKNLDGT